MRLIDADALMDKLPKVDIDRDERITKSGAVADFMCLIFDAPTIDAVPVVRCEDCELHDSCYAENVFKIARLDLSKTFCCCGKHRAYHGSDL